VVLERLEKSGAAVRRTDAEGALTLGFGRDGIAVSAERQARRRYWHGR
jgi:competence protein ComEC